MMEYVPLIVGAGLFIGAIFAGIWKGKKEGESGKHTEVVGGVIQDNLSMLMMSEQLRVNKEEMAKVIDAMKELTFEIERLREHAKDITVTLSKTK